MTTLLAELAPRVLTAAKLPTTAVRAVVTMDLHASDRPEDIHFAGEWLAAAGVRVTAFLPTSLLEHARYRRPLLAFAALGHEIESHSHHHDWTEMEALGSGRGRALAFLEESRDRHRQFFGRTPTAFRSPCWCRIGPAALDELARLGYEADCSATPQRLPGASSTPMRPGWLLSPRAPHLLRPGLLEIPTSTVLFPFGAPTALTLRGGIAWLLGVLELEAALFPDRVLVFQTHAEDWNPAAPRPGLERRLSWRDFLPRPRGGFAFRHFLHCRDSGAIARLHRELLDRLARLGLGTIAEARSEWEARQVRAMARARTQVQRAS